MKKTFALAIILSVVPWSLVSFPLHAAPENVCVDRVQFIERLKRQYSERQVSNGINYNGVVVEVFASPEGHFTILATSPDGVSCLIASGDNWQEAPILKADAGI
jgi:hypothetical protein